MTQKHLLTALGLAITVSGISTATASEWQLEATSRVGFSFQQQGTKYTGRFDTFTAVIDIDPANVEGGSIIGTVQTDSVNTRDYDRDATLTDGDWFDSGNYPEAIFESESIAADGNGDGAVDAADYTVWRDHLVGRRRSTAVPEPGALTVAALAIGALTTVRRRG